MPKRIKSEAHYRVKYRFEEKHFILAFTELLSELEKCTEYYKTDNKLVEFNHRETWHLTFCDGFLTLDATIKCPIDFQFSLYGAFRKSIKIAKKKYKQNHEKDKEAQNQ